MWLDTGAVSCFGKRKRGWDRQKTERTRLRSETKKFSVVEVPHARKERDTPEGITRVVSRDREVWLGDCLCTEYRVEVTRKVRQVERFEGLVQGRCDR